MLSEFLKTISEFVVNLAKIPANIDEIAPLTKLVDDYAPVITGILLTAVCLLIAILVLQVHIFRLLKSKNGNKTLSVILLAGSLVFGGFANSPAAIAHPIAHPEEGWDRKVHDGGLLSPSSEIPLGALAHAALHSGKSVPPPEWAIKTFKDLVNKNGDVNVVFYMPYWSGDYANPLRVALSVGDYGYAKELIASGADVSGFEFKRLDGTPYNIGTTYAAPLWLTSSATRYGQEKVEVIEMMEIILAAGADVNEVNYQQDRTALQEVAYNGTAEAVELLLLAGADLTMKGGRGKDALSAAKENWTDDESDTAKKVALLENPPGVDSELIYRLKNKHCEVLFNVECGSEESEGDSTLTAEEESLDLVGAIAYYIDSEIWAFVIAWDWDYDDQSGARQAALGECKSLEKKCKRVNVSVFTDCISVVEDSNTIWFSGGQRTKSGAKEVAMADCNTESDAPKTCKEIFAACNGEDEPENEQSGGIKG